MSAAEDQQIGCYAFIRYGQTYSQSVKNSVIKNKAIAKSYTCNIIGMATNLEVIEDGNCDEAWKKEMRSKGMLVLGFENEEKARMCILHTHDFKQQDWMSTTDIMFLPLQKVTTYKGCLSKPEFQVVDMAVYNERDFLNAVEGDMPAIDSAAPECEGAVVVAKDVREFRGTWETHLFVIHQWESKCAFDTFYESNKYKSWRDKRHNLARTYMYTFHVETPKNW